MGIIVKAHLPRFRINSEILDALNFPLFSG